MKKKKVTIQFALKSVRTTSFSFTSANVPEGQKEFFYHINTYYEANNTTKRMIIEPTVEAFADQNEKMPIFSLRVRNEFSIRNFDEFLHEEDKVLKVTFPIQFIISLVSISLGTTRGILLEKLSTTDMSDFILPVHDAAQMVMPIADKLENFPVD